MEAAHRERTPWRPERKEELKYRRWCRSDAEGDGSVGDGHRHDAEFLVLQALAAPLITVAETLPSRCVIEFESFRHWKVFFLDTPPFAEL